MHRGLPSAGSHPQRKSEGRRSDYGDFDPWRRRLSTETQLPRMSPHVARSWKIVSLATSTMETQSTVMTSASFKPGATTRRRFIRAPKQWPRSSIIIIKKKKIVWELRGSSFDVRCGAINLKFSTVLVLDLTLFIHACDLPEDSACHDPITVEEILLDTRLGSFS